jgi:hypothetical protein
MWVPKYGMTVFPNSSSAIYDWTLIFCRYYRHQKCIGTSRKVIISGLGDLNANWWYCGEFITINARLQMVCTFIGTLCITHCIAICGALDVTDRRLVAIAGRLVVDVGWRRCCLEDCWEYCSSLELARWGELFSEARWNQRVNWSGWFSLSLRRPTPVQSSALYSLRRDANRCPSWARCEVRRTKNSRIPICVSVISVAIW